MGESIKDPTGSFGFAALLGRDQAACDAALKDQMLKAHRLTTCKKIYDLLRSRDQVFKTPNLFSDPAWDILLDLYLNQALNKQVAKTNDVVGRSSAHAVAMRWLLVLKKEGLITWADDPVDGRRQLVTLTDEGMQKINDVLDQF